MPDTAPQTDLDALRRYHRRQAERCQREAERAEQQGKTRWFRTWLSRVQQHRAWLAALDRLTCHNGNSP